MGPVILVKDGKPAGAIGLPGGRTIPSVMAHFMVNIIDFGCTPAEMLNRPRIHTEGGIMTVTSDLPMTARREIEGVGLQVRAQESIGGGASAFILGDDLIVGCAQKGPEAALGL